MLRGWVYREGETTAEQVSDDDLRASAADTSSVLWIDCADPDAADLETVQSVLGVHPMTIEDLAHANQRTKLERYPDYFHVAVRDCALVDDTLVAREVDIVFSNGWLLTVHRGAAEPEAGIVVDDARQRFERQRDESGSTDEGFLLWAVLDVVVDRYFLLTEAIDDRLDDVEELVFSEETQATPRELFAARRALVEFRHAAGPLREVLAQLLRREVECVSEKAIVHMQDVYDHTLRVLDQAESQRELAAGLLEAQLSIQSNQMNQVMKATSSWGAILIVATLIAGIYGMNFKHIPELAYSWGYPGALGLMVATTGTLYFVFKRKGWL